METYSCCYFNNFGKDYLMFKINFDQKCQFPDMDNSKISLFYKEVVLSWHTTNIVNCPPTYVFQIKNEIIWGNRYILNNNKTLYMKRWIDADITHIGDICDINGFIKLQYLKEKLKTANAIHEYKIVLDSIPISMIRWRDCIKQTVDPNWQKDNLLFTWNNNKYNYRDLKNITCKYIYSFLIDKKAKQASSEQSWNLSFQTNVDWSSVWIYQTINLTGHMCLVEFNFNT